MRSATCTGWFIIGGRHTTPWPMPMCVVRPAMKARNVSGALMWAYWLSAVCSTAQITSKPSSSARSTCSRISWKTRWSASLDTSTVCAS